MTEKIEWYKEVLELEPNSKVFFPLARLLAAAHRDGEAIAALEHGLERHEEFLEARLFLIELLYKTGRQDACARQIERLNAMFASYAGFWQAWAACLSGVEGEADTATVLRFLGAHFLHGPISLHEVLNRGLETLQKSPARSDHGVSQTSVARVKPVPANSSRDALARSARQSVASPIHAFEEESYDNGSTSETEDVHIDDDGEEHFSLRTRSMAEVLAEQGDIKGALDIYNELAAAATLPEECADLEHRIATLTARLGVHPEPVQDIHPTEGETGRSTDRLISMLEALAERVEARARS